MLGIPGQGIPNWDCPGKTGTVGQLEYLRQSCISRPTNIYGQRNLQVPVAALITVCKIFFAYMQLKIAIFLPGESIPLTAGP